MTARAIDPLLVAHGSSNYKPGLRNEIGIIVLVAAPFVFLGAAIWGLLYWIGTALTNATERANRSTGVDDGAVRLVPGASDYSTKAIPKPFRSGNDPENQATKNALLTFTANGVACERMD